MVIAIVSHKWSDALTVGLSFVSAEVEFVSAVKYMVFYSFMTPLGILLGYFVSQLGNEKMVGTFKAISVGTFIYISCGEIIVEEFAISKNKAMKFLFYCLGVTFIVLVGLIPEK